MNQETPGSIFKRERENRKIQLKTAAEETKMTKRHIQGLEDDNFGVFPGETYILGFLRNYANYLELDPEYIIQLYRGSQIAQKEIPLEELTRPTLTKFDKIRTPLICSGILAGIVGLVFLTFNFIDNSEKSPQKIKINPSENINNFLDNSTEIPSIDTENISLHSGFTTAVIELGKGINFSIANKETFLIVEEVKYSKEGTNSAVFLLYPGKSNHTLFENQTQELNSNNANFALTLMGTTPNNVKIQINALKSLAQDKPVKEESRIRNPSNFIIILDAIMTSENFVEFYVDGKPTKKGIMASGSRVHYEANDVIQMKIGDAGGIQLKINGNSYKLGRRGETVNKIIRKEKDPIEQTKYRVVMKDA